MAYVIAYGLAQSTLSGFYCIAKFLLYSIVLNIFSPNELKLTQPYTSASEETDKSINVTNDQQDFTKLYFFLLFSSKFYKIVFSTGLATINPVGSNVRLSGEVSDFRGAPDVDENNRYQLCRRQQQQQQQHLSSSSPNAQYPSQSHMVS